MNFDPKNYVVFEQDSIRDALTKIQKNKLGMVCVASKSQQIIGLSTDGDIRLGLLAGLNLDESISQCCNRNFIWAEADEPRINLLKKIDAGVRFIPILDSEKRLVSVVSADFLPLKKQEEIYIRSRAPVRISLGGGGSDLTRYFLDNGGAVINGAVSLFSHATMKVVKNPSITITSLDLDDTFTALNLDDALNRAEDSSFKLILAILKIVNPAFGFELSLHSDFSVGSGLGGSATLCAAVLGCFNHLRNDRWDKHELSEIAFQAERLYLGIAGGWQDQYASVFGGMNFLEFGANETLIYPLRMDPDVLLELEESLVLCDTGISHNSGDIHLDQQNKMSAESIKRNVEQNVELTYKIRSHLLAGRLEKIGEALHEGWQLKKTFSSHISNEILDTIYEGALNNGASGGKLLGAGGGGYFLFYAPPFKKIKLLTHLKSKGLKVQPFQFEKSGLKTWSSRMENSEDF